MSHKRRLTRPNHMTPDERAECVRLYQEGATRDRLAEIFDRDRRTIDKLIARRGAYRPRIWR